MAPSGWSDHFPRLQKLLATALSIVFALTNAPDVRTGPSMAKADLDLTLPKTVNNNGIPKTCVSALTLPGYPRDIIIYIKRENEILSEFKNRFRIGVSVRLYQAKRNYEYEKKIARNAELRDLFFIRLQKNWRNRGCGRINLINLVQKTTPRLPISRNPSRCIGNNYWQRETAITIEERRGVEWRTSRIMEYFYPRGHYR